MRVGLGLNVVNKNALFSQKRAMIPSWNTYSLIYVVLVLHVCEVQDTKQDSIIDTNLRIHQFHDGLLEVL